MDRSYLSDQEVVAASRDFVCIRLSTYEDMEEAAFMKSIYRFRGGTLKNSLFAILDPEGKKHLAEPGRSPKFTYEDGAAMASGMRKIAKKYPAKKSEADLMGLPYFDELRLALNVTACDSQRLLIVFGEKESERMALEKKLLPLAWRKDFIGKFLYVQCSDPKELEGIADGVDEACVLIVEADSYGLKGRVLETVPLAKVNGLEKILLAATDNKQGSKDSKRQIGRGRRIGVRWETGIEVEDKGQVDPSQRRSRGRGR